MTPPDDRQRRQRPAAPYTSERERMARARQQLPADLDDDLAPLPREAYDQLLRDPEYQMPRYREAGPAPVGPTSRPASVPPVVPKQPHTRLTPRSAPQASGAAPRPPVTMPQATEPTTRTAEHTKLVIREASAPPVTYAPAAERLYTAAERAVEAEADLLRATTLSEFERPVLRSYHTPSAPPLSFNPMVMLGLVAIVSLAIIVLLGGNQGNSSPVPSRWSTFNWFSSNEPASANQSLALGGLAAPAGSPAPPGDYHLRAAPSLSAEQIDRILASYGSPATGTGAIWYQLGVEYQIDPAFAVAFFIMESSAGTAKGWAGNKPDGSTTHNIGNIICAGYPTCYGRFRDYPSWEAGIRDWYRLIDVEYLNGRGHRTVADIIPVYAPAVENDVNGYVSVVQRLVDQWRAQGVR